MTRKNWLLIASAVLLGGFSLYLNKDWFAKDNIQISHRSRPARSLFGRRRAADDSPANPMVFMFDRKLKLTAIEVFPFSDVQTNKYPHPIWHLISDSNSVPIKELAYGLPIRGMRPAVKGAAPDPLQPGQPYLLRIETGNLKVEHGFIPDPKTE